MKWDEVYHLVQWRWNPQGAKFLERYPRFDDAQIRYPHLQVHPFHSFTNFLLPRPVGTHTLIPVSLHLTPILKYPLISQPEALYVFLIPSILRALVLNRAADSLRSLPFTDQSGISIIRTS
ncbi:hypothetical protein GYMLUDRAFT_46897, partial [Collybiopsis luxurians FD-317 M1]